MNKTKRGSERCTRPYAGVNGREYRARELRQIRDRARIHADVKLYLCQVEAMLHQYGRAAVLKAIDVIGSDALIE